MDEGDEDLDLLIERHVEPVSPLPAARPIDSSSSSTSFLRYFNLRQRFNDVFQPIRDRIWFRIIQSSDFSSTYNRSSVIFLLSIGSILFVVVPRWILLLIIGLFSLLDLIIPLLVYYHWSVVLQSLRHFFQTIDGDEDWLLKMHGFQLIRPSSSLFDEQLVRFRQSLFEELRKHFLLARSVARSYPNSSEQMICAIDLNEFGPLIKEENAFELRKTTNQFDRAAIKSMWKLCRLQIDEMIELIHLHRPRSFRSIVHYHREIARSIANLRQAKERCAILLQPVNLSSSIRDRNRLTPCFFLLRSICEELFSMNEENRFNGEKIQRMIQDLKLVMFSLEALETKGKTSVPNANRTENETNFNENSTSEISTIHRFDDRLAESIDEVLFAETGRESDDEDRCTRSDSFFDQQDQRFLGEQRHSLMKELENAIEGKKREWNEREQRLFIDQSNEIAIVPVEKRWEKPVLLLPPSRPPLSMLDELKQTVSHHHRMNNDEDVFGEDDG